MLGLGRADITFRSKKKSWEEHPNLDTNALVWVHDRSNWVARLILTRKPLRHVGTMRVIRRRTRDMAVIQQSGVSLIDVGELGKVTNGVAAACYGLALGVPKVTLCGLSLRDVGHSYDQKGRRRRQLDEDLLVLRALAADERVSTTEHSLAEDAGIRHQGPREGIDDPYERDVVQAPSRDHQSGQKQADRRLQVWIEPRVAR